MNIIEKMSTLRSCFRALQESRSMLYKTQVIHRLLILHPEIEDDLNYCMEVISGERKIGYTIEVTASLWNDWKCKAIIEHNDASSFEEFFAPLYGVYDKSDVSISQVEKYYAGLGDFMNPIFNRTLRIGIGKSLLPKNDLSPMLAKKYEPGKKYPDKEFYLTQKLDGNRCLAKYNSIKKCWTFHSRSGKILNVNFNMKGMPTEHVYDGEMLSPRQMCNPSQENFNELSGIVNSKLIRAEDKNLGYVIFDISSDLPYRERSRILREECLPLINKEVPPETANVFILSLLAVCDEKNLDETVAKYLDFITSHGGEGVMINLGSYGYQHKRTDKILKVKRVYTMDMRVTNIFTGTGKYEGLVGALECTADSKDQNITYTCMVGSGLSDCQRVRWTACPEEILGQIVEVAYFSSSQSKMLKGTKIYALRFPRFKRFRDDKQDTSVD